jgi:hypothetical protein
MQVDFRLAIFVRERNGIEDFKKGVPFLSSAAVVNTNFSGSTISWNSPAIG